jgi:CRISPR/Cas system CMR-associated protein Cmr3 (group 5 of RAMP superfamily)
VRETNQAKKRPTRGFLKFRGLKATVISLITREDFVIAEEFSQISSFSN